VLNDRRFTGLLVEPVPVYADMLARNYDPTGRFVIERAAVTDLPGEVDLYYVDESAPLPDGRPVPAIYRGAASLGKEHVVEHLPAYVQPAVRCIKVPCMTCEQLLARHGFKGVDLVQIDTEGHDFVILRQIDLARLKPKIVIYEHKHLNDSDRASAIAHLERQGYRCIRYEVDTLALAVD
jgi:FkbM family methyltransferase